MLSNITPNTNKQKLLLGYYLSHCRITFAASKTKLLPFMAGSD